MAGKTAISRTGMKFKKSRCPKSSASRNSKILENFVFLQGTVNFFTDGSKLRALHQAEVTVIKEAGGTLLKSVSPIRELRHYSDSQAAVRILSSLMERSKLVRCAQPRFQLHQNIFLLDSNGYRSI